MYSEIAIIAPKPANHAACNARYAVIITRHPTHSEQPAAAVDGGDQDAHTTRGRPPPEPERRSTAALRSVGAPERRQLPTQRPRPRPHPRGHHRGIITNHQTQGVNFHLPPGGQNSDAVDNLLDDRCWAVAENDDDAVTRDADEE